MCLEFERGVREGVVELGWITGARLEGVVRSDWGLCMSGSVCVCICACF